MVWLAWSTVAWAVPTWGPDDLVRVDDPDHPDAVARSATGALVEGIPEEGPWRPASLPEPDVVEGQRLQEVLTPGVDDDLLDVLGVRAWHQAGALGQGVRVAVFDSSFFAGITEPEKVEPFTTHDCFASMTCSAPIDAGGPAFAAESGHHGWACAEVVRQLAPEAELHLVRVNSFTALENAVDWAIRERIDVVTMSMSYYNDSFGDGGGPYGPMLRRMEAAGVLLVTSAGNTADQHWWSNWVDGDRDGVLDGPRADVSGLAGRAERGLWWDAPAGAVSVNVNWNQYDDCGRTDLSARLVDEQGWVVSEIDRVQDPDGDSCVPTERLRGVLRSDQLLRIEVVHERGPVEDLVVDVLVRSGALLQPEPTRSLTDPGSHPLAFAVGAARILDYDVAPPQTYSSWGPNHAGAEALDITGPDGTSTATYGPAGFYGTSASSPALAGMLAVVMSAEEGLSSREASERLKSWAQRDDPQGRFEPRFGAGKAHLPRPDPMLTPCGQRPMLLAFLFPWLPWWRGRRGPWSAGSDDAARTSARIG